MLVACISIVHCSLPVISLPSGHKHYLANVPGPEHLLVKDTPPLGMNTFRLTRARYAIDISLLVSSYEFTLV